MNNLREQNSYYYLGENAKVMQKETEMASESTKCLNIIRPGAQDLPFLMASTTIFFF